MSYTHTVSRETHLLLEQYSALLTKWNAKINLIGDSDDIWNRHIWDSYQLVDHIPTNSGTLIDLGSGAGLPGLVIAMARPIHVTLVERDQRKSAFLMEAVRELKLKNVTILNKDIATIEAKPYDIVTARALAPLVELCELSHPFVGTNTICLFAKGERFATELEAARRGWGFDAQMVPSKTHPESAIIVLKNLIKIENR